MIFKHFLKYFEFKYIFLNNSRDKLEVTEFENIVKQIIINYNIAKYVGCGFRNEV